MSDPNPMFLAGFLAAAGDQDAFEAWGHPDQKILIGLCRTAWNRLIPDVQEGGDYILVMNQGKGCDYTIGCGVVVEHLNADNAVEARDQAIERIDYFGGFGHNELDSATVYRVEGAASIGIQAIVAERKAANDKLAAETAEASEKAEYERLHAIHGGGT